MMSQSEMATYQAEAEAERDRIMAEFVLSQAEGYALSVVVSNDVESTGDTWAWWNDEQSMNGLSAW